MNYICSWLCADEEGAESLFPQTGKKSSSKEHQDIYWRCLIVFFITSKRFNKSEKHLLFTNVTHLPFVDGRNVRRIFDELEVEIIFTDFKYKTPPGYYGMFQNQFYEFSILEHIATHNHHADDLYLITDADCIFLKPAKDLFNAAKPNGFISFEDDVLPDYVINGLSRNDLKTLYEELLNDEITEIPSYHLGEFLLSSVHNIRRLFEDFTALFPQLIERHDQGLKKFNEEAHTLSYLYFKNGFRASKENIYLKRIWTNPLFYRNVEPTDVDKYIWHLPSEKMFGLMRLYKFFINHSNFAFDITHKNYTAMVQEALSIPHLPFSRRMEYYVRSCYRATNKRLKKLVATSSRHKIDTPTEKKLTYENCRAANHV
jgi:hypothetical protein